MLDDLVYARGVINPQVAHISAGRREIEKCDGDFSARQFMNQAQADFGGHDGHTASLVFHHSLGRPAGAPRIVIGVAENCVVTQLLSAQFKSLDDFGKERIFNIRDDDSQSAVTVARGQVPRVGVGNIAEALHCGDDQSVSFAPNLPGFIQDIGDGGGRYPCGFRDITNGERHFRAEAR